MVEEVRAHMKEMLEAGAICFCQSPWCNIAMLLCRLIILLYSYYYLKYFSFTEHVRLLKTSFQALLRSDEELSRA